MTVHNVPPLARAQTAALPLPQQKRDDSKTSSAAAAGVRGAQSDPATHLRDTSAQIKELKERIEVLEDRVDVAENRCSYLQEDIAKDKKIKKEFQAIKKQISTIVVLFQENLAVAANTKDYEDSMGVIANHLRENDNFELIIEGHSNNHWWGGSTVDMQRSEERAQTVRSSLLSHFADNSQKEAVDKRLQIEKMGFTKPVVNSKDPKNCRATFSVRERIIEEKESEEKVAPLPLPQPRRPRPEPAPSGISMRTLNRKGAH